MLVGDRDPMDYDLPHDAQPIDVDMDGTPDFMPVEGEPGTYTIGDTTTTLN